MRVERAYRNDREVTVMAGGGMTCAFANDSPTATSEPACGMTPPHACSPVRANVNQDADDR